MLMDDEWIEFQEEKDFDEFKDYYLEMESKIEENIKKEEKKSVGK